jgi:hypothetical protein
LAKKFTPPGKKSNQKFSDEGFSRKELSADLSHWSKFTKWSLVIFLSCPIWRSIILVKNYPSEVYVLTKNHQGKDCSGEKISREESTLRRMLRRRIFHPHEKINFSKELSERRTFRRKIIRQRIFLAKNVSTKKFLPPGKKSSKEFSDEGFSGKKKSTERNCEKIQIL